MPDKRTVRGADQPGHVAADRGDEEAHQRDVDQRAGHRREHVPAEAAAGREVGDQPADRHHAGERDQGHVTDGDVLLGPRQQRGVPGGARPRGRHRGAQSRGHRSDEFRQRPDRRHADGAGADETHLVAPGVLRELRDRLRARRECREVRHAPDPADQRADEHRDADPQAHQVADGEQREGQEEIEAGDAAAFTVTEAEIPHHVAGENARGHDAGKGRRDDRAPDHGRKPGTAVLDRRRHRRARRRRP